MLKLCNKPLKTTLFSTLVIFYICLGVTILKRNGYNEEIQQSKPTDGINIKTIVGYSLEYQITEDIKRTYKCEQIQQPQENTGSLEKRSVRMLYDPDSDIFLINAFYDRRLPPYGYIRTVAMVSPNATLYCQIRRQSSQSEVVVVKATIVHIWSKHWDSEGKVPYVPALVSCLDSQPEEKPSSWISLVKEPCQKPTKTIRVLEEDKPEIPAVKRLTFTICVKPLNFDSDIRNTLKEWVLINQLLGVTKIVIYYLKLSEENLSLLKSYERNGFVNLIHFVSHSKFLLENMSFHDKTWLRRKLEILAYNDCFYKHLNSTDFVIPLDIDEIIVPKASENFEQMLFQYNNKKSKDLGSVLEQFSSFSIRNAYFFKNNVYKTMKSAKTKLPFSSKSLVNKLSKSVSVFNRKLRSWRYSPGVDSTKSFINVQNTLTIFNHYSFHVLKPSLRQVILPTDIVQLNHYRDFCDWRLIDNCTSYLKYVTYDDSLDRFRNLINVN